MSDLILDAYKLWTVDEGLPDLWPDTLIHTHVQTLTTKQRYTALAYAVLMGPDPKNDALVQ
jgi:hypothetical protein